MRPTEYRLHFPTPLLTTTLLTFSGWMMATAASAQAEWPQWGGPSRNFVCESTKLAETWPEGGPTKLWSKSLGDGFSAILCDGQTVYTQYRAEDSTEETVVALTADTGRRRWIYSYPAPISNKATTNFGKGPNATPLLHGDSLITIGFNAQLHCLDRNTGKVRWKRNLWEEFEGTFLNFGYAASPLAFGDDVIILLGGEGNAILSLRMDDGAVTWKKQSYLNSYASPILIQVDGNEQVVAFVGSKIVGIDPKSGEHLWDYPHENQWKTNISTPLFGEDQVLFFGSGSDLGSTAVKITKKDNHTTIEPVWTSKRVKADYANLVRVGDRIYGTTGDAAVKFLVAVNAKDGSILWRKRGIATSTILAVDEKLLLLDEDGKLVLGKPGEDGLEILAQAKILENVCWTIPTLVGNRLFVRDRKTISAFELPGRR